MSPLQRDVKVVQSPLLAPCVQLQQLKWNSLEAKNLPVIFMHNAPVHLVTLTSELNGSLQFELNAESHM